MKNLKTLFYEEPRTAAGSGEGLPPGRLHRTIEMLKEIVLSELLSPGKWGDFVVVKKGVWLPVTG